MPEVSKPYFISRLTLAGFRAYLDPKTFDFSQKRCLAVFAPNGSGKSSIVDALEFMFSDAGTLERIGLKAINNYAGLAALEHNLAATRKIDPLVAIKFRRDTTLIEGSRKATGKNRERPEAATRIGACFTADPLIRGYSLRRFVEDTKPEQRYAQVASWLRLTPLVDVQKNVRSLRQQLKAAAEDSAGFGRVDSNLARETANVVTAWQESTVVAYANTEVISPLAANLTLAVLDEGDPAFALLKERAKSEEQQAGLASLRLIRNAASALYVETFDASAGKNIITGLLCELDDAISDRKAAAVREVEERGKAAGAIFAGLWKAAEPLFAEGAPELGDCPICATPLSKSAAGSVGGVRKHIASHMAELAAYAKAKEALDTAATHIVKVRGDLVSGAENLLSLLTGAHGTLRTVLSVYLAAVKGQAADESPDRTQLVAVLIETEMGLTAAIEEIEKRQGEHTYAKALAKLDRLVTLKAEHALAERTRSELTKLSNTLNAQAIFISGEIRKKLQALLDGLRVPTNEIYKQIQGDKAAHIRLELPPEDDTNQQRLNLLIDFASNRKSVQPGGYLSDSQMHSLALALRLAAIKRFNGAAPVLVLDDIVTSYDADHRRTISGMLASQFGEFQILITTHDERFFIYLKDQLAEEDWQYLRITRLDPDFGPRFTDHKVTDAMLEKRWSEGESAANEIRQAEEEWLLARCRDFAVNVHIRPVDKAYSYERGELAEALAVFLKGAGLTPAMVPGVGNRVLKSLQQGAIENFGSHFQDAQYGNGSIGDEKTRWLEFKAFRDQFICHKCGRRRFERPLQLKRPVCAHDSCQAPFEFAAAQ